MSTRGKKRKQTAQGKPRARRLAIALYTRGCRGRRDRSASLAHFKIIFTFVYLYALISLTSGTSFSAAAYTGHSEGWIMRGWGGGVGGGGGGGSNINPTCSFNALLLKHLYVLYIMLTYSKHTCFNNIHVPLILAGRLTDSPAPIYTPNTR